MIAIAAQSFGEPSETFLRQHVRMIAPGETVLICQNAKGAERLGCPVLGEMSSRPHKAEYRGFDRLRNSVRVRFDAYFRPGVPRADRRRITEFLKAHRVEAVLAEFGHTGVQILSACEDAGARLYVHFHGVDATARTRRRHTVHEYRRLFRRAHGIITPSRWLGERLVAVGLPEEKLHVSPNGVDTERFRPGRPQPGLVVAVGRLVEKKAPDKTIRAFAAVLRECPDARLEMFGDGPLMGRCQRVIRELGIDGSVRLMGARPSDEIAARMAQASLFVQHSVTAPDGDSEGFPVAPIEAMACAVPVIATRHSGIPELVQDGRTGILIDEHDVPGMAKAMIELLSDRDRSRRMGEVARTMILNKYTVTKVSTRLCSIMGIKHGRKLQEDYNLHSQVKLAEGE